MMNTIALNNIVDIIKERENQDLIDNEVDEILE
jgi:hypothetical protein